MSTLRKNLAYPFSNQYPITFQFGAHSSNRHVNNQFLARGFRGHEGIDFGLPRGTAVRAAYRGNVAHAGSRGEYGLTVILQHTWGKSIYAHLQSLRVPVGKFVRKGGIIGTSGDTGNTFGAHLHFGIKPSDTNPHNGFGGYINPAPHFSTRTRKKAT